jgi:hypothetical protein
MKKLISMLMPVVLIAMTISFASARGAPNEQNPFTDQAIVSVDVSPTVANVPPMTVGYDVICNLSTLAIDRAGNAQYITDTSEATGLSTTGDERNSLSASTSYRARSAPQPALVLVV